jgi:hypothetical protein
MEITGWQQHELPNKKLSYSKKKNGLVFLMPNDKNLNYQTNGAKEIYAYFTMHLYADYSNHQYLS